MTVEQSKAKQRRAEQMLRLTEVARGTDMGTLLRKFWQPVAQSRNVKAGSAIPVRILGEDLTLYRGQSGKPYLVGGRCAHRLTLLHTGWVEGEDIRCMYHGWKYDGAGQCNQRPAEPDAGLPDVKIANYPVHEYCGLIFAYMGAGAAPEFDLPRKSGHERDGLMLFTREETWDCNWFQAVENSLDAVHVSFAHRLGSEGNFGGAITGAIPKLEYLETDAGIRQIATRSANNVRISDWTFPNNNHIRHPGVKPEDPWLDLTVWVVPVDDVHFTRVGIWAVPSTTKEADRRIADYFENIGEYNPADHRDDLFLRKKFPDDPVLELISAQDYIAQVGQGPIADRTNEWLGSSDAGLMFLRKVFWRELDAIRDGRTTKTWRRLEEHVELPIPVPEAAMS